MKKLTLLMIAALFAAGSLYADDDDEQKKPKRPKTNANYRKSQSRKATTVKNPHAITSRNVVADKETTAAFNDFAKKCNSMNKILQNHFYAVKRCNDSVIFNFYAKY